jgi:glycerophosphoryl diester phosphodiesterase
VIGHRGASGHRPEHTAPAYRLAWRSGADSVEPDVVSTRDGVLVCRHDLDLARTTDVAQHPEFAARRRRFRVDGADVHGWFVGDFDLEELRLLRARERWPRMRPGSARYDGRLGLLTLEELLDLRAAESARAGRPLGVHIELKHPEVFEGLGMPLHEPLIALLRKHRLTSPLAPAAVMSFDGAVLKRLRRAVDVELVRLVDHDRPVRRGWLQRTGTYASGVGLSKQLALSSAKAVGKVQDAGLDLLVWTLRSENRYLPPELRVPGRPRTHGHAAAEVARLLDLGVDGLLTDFPEVAVEVLRSRAVAVA